MKWLHVDVLAGDHRKGPNDNEYQPSDVKEEASVDTSITTYCS